MGTGMGTGMGMGMGMHPSDSAATQPTPKELLDMLRRAKSRSKIERFYTPFLHATKCVDQRVKFLDSSRAAVVDSEAAAWAVFQMYGKNTDGLLVKCIR